MATAAVVAVVDQVTKELALRSLRDGAIDLFGGAVTLRLTYNSGGAFGLLQGLPGLFLLATLVIAGLILVWARGVEERGSAVALGMILGGGLGNAADRIARDLGGRVVDFVDLHFWPVFNVADSAIVVGVCLVLLLGARRRPSPRPGPGH
ncbi:MAG TPA: signal peptidase II [Actinomycetota bacterium]|nr:signal peptidase II [Actinomycetota bacterium]